MREPNLFFQKQPRVATGATVDNRIADWPLAGSGNGGIGETKIPVVWTSANRNGGLLTGRRFRWVSRD